MGREQQRGCFLGRWQSPRIQGEPSQPSRHTQQTLISTIVTPLHHPLYFFIFLSHSHSVSLLSFLCFFNYFFCTKYRYICYRFRTPETTSGLLKVSSSKPHKEIGNTSSMWCAKNLAALVWKTCSISVESTRQLPNILLN